MSTTNSSFPRQDHASSQATYDQLDGLLNNPFGFLHLLDDDYSSYDDLTITTQSNVNGHANDSNLRTCLSQSYVDQAYASGSVNQHAGAGIIYNNNTDDVAVLESTCTTQDENIPDMRTLSLSCVYQAGVLRPINENTEPVALSDNICENRLVRLSECTTHNAADSEDRNISISCVYQGSNSFHDNADADDVSGSFNADNENRENDCISGNKIKTNSSITSVNEIEAERENEPDKVSEKSSVPSGSNVNEITTQAEYDVRNVSPLNFENDHDYDKVLDLSTKPKRSTFNETLATCPDTDKTHNNEQNKNTEANETHTSELVNDQTAKSDTHDLVTNPIPEQHQAVAEESLEERPDPVPDQLNADPLFVPDALSSDESDYSSDESGTKSSKRSRKRKRNVASWTRNIRRNARNTGQPYTNSRGKTVKEKTAPVGIHLCQCRRKCGDKINDQDRRTIFETYYNLDCEAKRTYLFGHMTPCEPKVLILAAETHRQLTFIYTVSVNMTHIEVCKTAFCCLHQVSRGKLQTIIEQKKSGATALSSSRAGKHATRPNRLSSQLRTDAIDHIKMFPVEQSHYSRNANPNRQYLSSTLTVPKMYEEYKIWCEKEEKIPLSLRGYRDIFLTEFNYGFGKPRSDTCETCDNLETENLQAHKDEAAAAFREMKKDRQTASEKSNTHYFTFDLEKTLPLPKLSTSVAYYLRQLWFYNLGIHLISGDKTGVYFQHWLESQGGRGVNEVGSAIIVFLQKAGIKDGVLHAWSDSCAGQNKNFFLVCLWQFLIKTQNFQEIHHKFPIPGHSFMDSDRDFGKVEQICQKTENVYSSNDYAKILRSSQRKPTPVVTELKDHFLDIKALPDLLNLVNRQKNTDGDKVNFRDKVRWIKVSRFGEYEYRTTFNDDEIWKKVKINRFEPNDDNAQVLEIPRIENPQHPIKKAKFLDLQKQLKYIPEVYHDTFKNLIYN